MTSSYLLRLLFIVTYFMPTSFVNGQSDQLIQYLPSGDATFAKVISHTSQQEYFTCGYNNDSGYFAKLANDMSIVWDFTYKHPNASNVYFRDMVELDNGDFLLYGSALIIDTNNRHNLLIRVTSDGTIVWAKTYFHTETRVSWRILKLANNSFILLSWSLPSNIPPRDNIELTKVDANGNVVATKLFGINQFDDQTLNIIPYNDGFVFAGRRENNSPSNWEPYIAAFDADLNILWNRKSGTENLGYTDYEDINLIRQVGTNEFLIVGEQGDFVPNGQRNAQQIYAYIFDPTSSSFTVNLFDFLPNEMEAVTYLGEMSNGGYLVIGSTTGFEVKDDIGFIAQLNSDLSLNRAYKIDLKGEQFYFESALLEVEKPDSLVLIGKTTNPTKGDLELPSVLSINLNASNCFLTEISPTTTQATFSASNWSTSIVDITMTVEDVDLTVESNDMIVFPALNISPRDVVTCDSLITLDAGDCFDSYLWSDGSQEQTLIVSTSQEVWVTTTRFCETFTDTIEVTFENGGSLSLGEDQMVCNDSFLIEPVAENIISYQWQDGSFDSTFWVTTSGAYALLGVTTCGDSLRDEIQVDFFDFPIQDTDLGNDTTLCQGEHINLSIHPDLAGFVTWQDGSEGTSFDVTESDSYWIAVNHPCKQYVDTVNVDFLTLPILDLPEMITVCDASDFVLEASVAFDSYQWNTGESTSSIQVTQTGNYQVTATHQCGKEVQTVSVNFIQTRGLDIANVFSPNGDGINDTFVVPDVWLGAVLTIYNRWGKKVFETTAYANDWNGKGLPTGVYYYRLEQQLCSSNNSYDGIIHLLR